MKQCFVLAAFFICFSVSHAQNKESLDTTIRTLEQLVVRGILAADTNMLKQVWAPAFMVNTPRNTIAENRDAVFAIQRGGLIDYRSFERIIEKMEIQDNIVVTMGYETYVPNKNLPEAKAGQTVKRRFTNVWMNKNGQWLQIARHASVICQ
jgi:hypothetical protein